MSWSRSTFLVIFVVSILIVGVMMEREAARKKKSKSSTVTACDGSICGCWNNKCWRYVDELATKKGDWWCYNGKPGQTHGRHMKFQSCEENNECLMSRECFGCLHYTGDEERSKKVC